MCVKTKTSFGCGHSYKTCVTCRNAPSSSQPCSDVDRHHFGNEGDCRECKAGGANVTRGRDGQGRYAQKIKRRQEKQSQSSAPLVEISGNRPPPSVTKDPWAPVTRRETKDWESPDRRAADQGWLHEHSQRKREIEALSESYSTPRKSSSRSNSYSYEQEQTLSKPATSRRKTTAEYNQAYPVESYSTSHHFSRHVQSELHSINAARSKQQAQRPNGGMRTVSYESIETVPPRGRRAYQSDLGYSTNYMAPVPYAVETRWPGQGSGEYNVPGRR